MGVYIKGDISGEQVTMTNTSGGGGWTTLFTASTTGYYRVTGEGYNSTTQGNCSLTVSGGTLIYGTNYVYLENYQTKQIDCVLYVTAGDNVEMYCERYSYSNGGGRNFSALSYGTISPECNELLNAYIGIPSPESITLDKSSITLTTVGQTEQLTATIEPEVSDHSVTWTSSDTTVATVSSSGLVTCVTPGTATITATTVNGLTATCGVSNGWIPGANTIAYYPLTSSTTVNDMKGSGTAYNLTNSGVSFGTYNGVDCANFNGSTYLSRTALSELSSAPFTISLYVYYPALPTTSQVGMTYIDQNDTGSGYRGFNLGMMNHSTMPHGQDYRFEILPGGGLFSGSQAQASGWVHIVGVYNNGVAYLYVNGALSNSGSKSYTYGPNSGFNIGCQVLGGQGYYLLGNISEVIIENKARTAQEVQDYYDQTKANYGIS